MCSLRSSEQCCSEDWKTQRDATCLYEPCCPIRDLYHTLPHWYDRSVIFSIIVSVVFRVLVFFFVFFLRRLIYLVYSRKDVGVHEEAGTTKGLFATFQGFTEISSRQSLTIARETGHLPRPQADVIANKPVRLHCPRSPGTFARFVTSSFGSRRGAVRTRCAKLLLVWKVERLPR